MNVEERFLKYITFDTQSDENSTTFPSTMKQKELGKYLADELKAIGAQDVELDPYGYVYATIPASKGVNAPHLAYIAHMDTSPAASGKNVKAVIDHEPGRDVIHTDGTTLLGADDKAGVAEIVTACEQFLQNPALPHPEIRVLFTPDEEVGTGVDHASLERLNAKYGFTVDGGEVGELSYECFNAASARVIINGRSFHPGDSFGKMKNACLMAAEFIAMLPEKETPATTQGREGFYHLDNMSGSVEKMQLDYILRDFDALKLEQKKKNMQKIVSEFNRRYGYAAAEITITDSYRNMIEALLPDYEFLLNAVRNTYEDLGIPVNEDPVRGGTDGARLSFEGLPCPNLGTGGHDFHGPHEWITIQSMRKVVDVLIKLAEKLS